jgi:hypothetical protein
MIFMKTALAARTCTGNGHGTTFACGTVTGSFYTPFTFIPDAELTA